MSTKFYHPQQLISENRLISTYAQPCRSQDLLGNLCQSRPLVSELDGIISIRRLIFAAGDFAPANNSNSARR